MNKNELREIGLEIAPNPPAPGWNHIILEGFCMRKLSCAKHKYHYEVTDFDTLKTKRVPNKCYDPNYKTPRKPNYCQNIVCQVCYFKSCPHLGIGEPDDEDYDRIMRFIGEMYTDEKENNYIA